MERSQWESSLPSVCVDRNSGATVGIFWSDLLVRAQVFLTAPSSLHHAPHAHTDRHTAHLHSQLHTDTCTHTHSLQSSSVAWSPCKFPTSTSCIDGRWERTSWKQWNELICRFASGFDVLSPPFLWPLVKKILISSCWSSPSLGLFWIGWITKGAASLIKLFILLHPPLFLSRHLLSHILSRQSLQSLFCGILAQLASCDEKPFSDDS